MICKYCHDKKKIRFQPSKVETEVVGGGEGKFSIPVVKGLVGFGPTKEIDCPYCG